MTLKEFNLTIEDAIMLHLLDYTKFQDEFEMPGEITQPGIASAVGIRRSHTANVIKSLKDKEYLIERTEHVKNIPRKRKIYFLSDKGKEYILKLRNSLLKKIVHIKNKQDKMENICISEINNKFSIQIPLLQLVHLVQPDNSIKMELLLDFEKKSIGVPPVIKSGERVVKITESMTCPSRFFGRENESEKINNWLKNEMPRIIVITGIPGIGKTSLASKVIGLFEDDELTNLFWYRFHEWDTLRSTLREVSDFLFKLNRNKLKFYINNHSKMELSEIMKILESDIQDLNAILVFDDIQKITPDLQQIFSMLVEILDSEKFNDINIIILSRDTLNFYDRRKVVIKNLVAELELSGLDSNACKKLLSQPEIEDSSLDKIYRLTQGHPLTIELINLHLTSQPDQDRSRFDVDEFIKDHRDLNRYLQEEILQDLTEQQKKILDLISVYRYPISADALLSESGIDHDSIDALISKCLIQVSATGYELHELIKNFFYRRLNHKLKAKYHNAAAEYYKSIIKDEYVQSPTSAAIEGQYHYIRCGNFNYASDLTVKHGDELISKGFTDELGLIINDLDPVKIPENIWAKVLIHKGHIFTVNGNWDDAMDCYQKSLKLCEKLGDAQGLVRAYNGSGVIFFHKGNWQKAMELYEKGLEFAEIENDYYNSSKILSNISLIHWGNGDLQLAIELMRKSLFLSEKLNDRQGIARALNNLGIIYWEQGEHDEAITVYKKSLKISEELEDKQTIAILLNNIGEAYRMKDMRKRAEEFYYNSLELSQELGFKWQVGQVYCNLGELYKKIDKDKSMEFLNRSFEIYKNLGAKREVQKVRDLISSL
jgi:ATP/maltotriose-dependent transcriptional regulator MalT